MHTHPEQHDSKSSPLPPKHPLRVSNRKPHWAQSALSAGAALIALVAIQIGVSLRGDTTNALLHITVSSNNQVKVTITNASPGDFFQILRQHELMPGTNWFVDQTGTNGQTNFFIDMWSIETGFLRALNCLDCDNDGVLNTQDANPFNASVLTLTVTIDSPTNGATLH